MVRQEYQGLLRFRGLRSSWGCSVLVVVLRTPETLTYQ